MKYSFLELMIRNKSPTSISLIMDLFAIFFTRFTSSISSEILPQLNLFIAMRPRDSLALLHNYINGKGADENIFDAFFL